MSVSRQPDRVWTQYAPQESGLGNIGKGQIDERDVRNSKALGIIRRASHPCADFKELCSAHGLEQFAHSPGLIDCLGCPIACDSSKSRKTKLVWKRVRKINPRSDFIIECCQQFFDVIAAV